MILINNQPHSLAQAVYVARRRAGLTQSQLATKLGCWPGEITSYETGRRGMQVSTLLRIMDACGWTIEAKQDARPVLTPTRFERGCAKVEA